ncbi:MAG: DUF2135 domain-containing protein [Candidatus Riflebacteria bacterium]|nr:DUF2135 domain-containing protein [Candidatus Riflebacteria bacterium]
MKRFPILFLLALCLCAWPGLAQDLPPQLLVEGTSQPLAVTKVDTQVTIHGLLAETRTTMVFSNPNDRQLAGDLYFPLPEGSTVSGYALDVNGVLVDGVVVEKQKGREVFETEMRKGVDPGLIEKVKGNNFKTRVFPIPARGSRTIMVKYVSELVPADAGAVYHLPLRFKDKIPAFSLRVAVLTGKTAPKIEAGGLADFAFETWEKGFLAETSLKNAALDKDLRVAIPDANRQPVLIEKDDQGDLYFYVNDQPQAPATAQAAPPSRLAIFWDASMSREKADHKPELEVLRGWFKTQTGPVTVDLVELRNALGTPQTFKVEGGKADALIAAIEAVKYDGGTQMGALSLDKLPASPDFCFLFTDGISNFGREEPAGIKVPVYIFSADSTANHSFLRYLATTTGGEYFNLNTLKPDQAIGNIGRPAFSFLGAEVEGGGADEIYPKVPRAVHGTLTLAGRLFGPQAKVKLNYGTNGKVTRTVEIEVKAADAASGDLLRRYWAQKKIEDLEIFPQRNEQEIVSTGKRFGIVTGKTSLIVLERPEQYIEHEIVPPATMAQWRKQYFAHMERRETQEKEAESAKLNEVAQMWKQRVAWWETEFDIPKDFRVHGADKGSARLAPGGGSGAAPQDALAGAPAPESAPMESEADESAAPQQMFNAVGGRLSAPPAPSPSAPMRERSRSAMSESKAKADRSEEAGERTVEPGVAIKAWTPDTPYLKKIKAADASKAFDVYLAERKEYGNSPAFFLDCSDFFKKEKQDALALQVLSNIAELEMENPALMRILAHRLAQIDELELSAMVFEEVLGLRKEEPQSYRDLALVLGRLERYPRAVELLWEVVRKRWDGRFPEVEVIALMELNNFLVKAKTKGQEVKTKIDERFVKNLDVDVRIIMTWDADMTDMDLWVTEPSNEKAYYGYSRTRIGGNVSRDFTRGYGPEEYCLHKAMKGMYTVQTNFFGSQAQSLAGAVTLQVDIFSNWGRPNEKRKSLTLRLTENKETFTVGEIEF